MMRGFIFFVQVEMSFHGWGRDFLPSLPKAHGYLSKVLEESGLLLSRVLRAVPSWAAGWTPVPLLAHAEGPAKSEKAR